MSLVVFPLNGRCGSHESEETNIRWWNQVIYEWMTHSRCTWLITGWISVLERISCMIQRQIHFNRHLLEKSCEVSNYFQKVISCFNRYRTHQRWYLNYTLSSSASVICMFVTEIMKLWLKTDAVSFMTDDRGSTNADVNVQITLTRSNAARDHNIVSAHVKGWGMKPTNHCHLGISVWDL